MPKRKPRSKPSVPIPAAITEKLARTPARSAAAKQAVPPAQRGTGHSPAPMRHQGR